MPRVEERCCYRFIAMVVAPGSTQRKPGSVAAKFQSRSLIQEIEMTKTDTVIIAFWPNARVPLTWLAKP